MNHLEFKLEKLLPVCLLALSLSACGGGSDHHSSAGHGHGDHGDHAEPAVAKGPHNGRLLTAGDFTLELAIFETGVPPEFRVWASRGGQAIKPQDLDLSVQLTRLGNQVDNIGFTPFGEALRGDTVIYEPHSFVVSIEAKHAGETYRWQYDNFEGRTKIEAQVAQALEIKTDTAGPKTLKQIVTVYGKINSNTERVRHVSARYNGVIKSVAPSIGEVVKQGQVLAQVESNESLRAYNIKAPISGVVTERLANPGEQTNNRDLFTIMDTSTVWADLAIFPADRKNIRPGLPVTITTSIGEQTFTGTIARINVMSEANQAVNARVVLENKDGQLLPGTFVTADIEVAQHPVALAVKRSGLQAFRDFTVVYTKIEDEYEVRMLELGRQDKQWVEVLGGLAPGSTYVTDNSYVIKADIEKSGASHDH